MMDIHNNPIVLEALGEDNNYYLSHNDDDEVGLQHGKLGEGVIFIIEPRANFVALACQGNQKGKYLSHANGKLSLQNSIKGDNELWVLHEFKNEDKSSKYAFECVGNEKGKFLSHFADNPQLQDENSGDSQLWAISFVSNYKKYLKTYFDKAENCLAALREALPNVTILTSQHDAKDSNELLKYFEAAQIFNTRLQQNPLAIVYCKTAADVSAAFTIATKNQIPIRVRAGGHDHEGESSGTNVVVIDVSEMTHIGAVDKSTGIIKIGAGNRFNRLTTALSEQNVMIAHGTCATVCITGFTLGGGWGPWTRRYGMNCEHLMGATIVLGDGSIVDVDEKDGIVPPLLWALRGGGGMSYGIVTELRIRTFELPKKLIKFELHWNRYDDKADYIWGSFPTLNILKVWEKVIQSRATSKLIGTNLKIIACPRGATFDYETISHGCCMYGYWEGNEVDLKLFVEEHFGNVKPIFIIDGKGGTNAQEQYAAGSLMSNWDRESFAKIQTNLRGLHSNPLPPDEDLPAPHKITSRLVNQNGLDEKGYEQLLSSLTSPLVRVENRLWGLFTYVTLGAIAGDYYRENVQSDNSAFPYKDKLYTIQYQTWWNVADDDSQYEDPSQNSPVYDNINKAMDWIDTARKFDIPNTSGAFISFKDNNIPTSVYFDKSYEKLKWVKVTHSKDHYNHLRTRKTIM